MDLETRLERDSEETGTESDMTEGTEETIIDPEKVPAKRSRRGVPRKTESPEERNHLQHTFSVAIRIG